MSPQISRAPFGATEHQSSRILFGAAALSEVSQSDADRTMETIIRYGVNHIDVASSYGNGEAEKRLAPWLRLGDPQFFLATKVKSRTKEKAKSEFYGSLERLDVDAVDLLQLHNLIEPEEWKVALGPGGALEGLLELREEGLVSFIGITGHGMEAPRTHREALERFPFDSVLAPYNWLLSRDAEYSRSFEALESQCAEDGIALQVIKSLARRPWPQERKAGTWYQPLTETTQIDLAIRWILSRPGVFINSVGDIDVLPRALETAARYGDAPERPSNAEMKELAAETQMQNIYDGRTALMK